MMSVNIIHINDTTKMIKINVDVINKKKTNVGSKNEDIIFNIKIATYVK
jgi:hypothetical protein